MTSVSSTLLVGSAGYIGSNCPWADIMRIDLKNGQDFLDLPPEKYDTIVFLAAQLESTLEAYEYNKMLYERMNFWAELFPETHFIYASSAAVYGEALSPRHEYDFLEPVNIYGNSKLLGEYYFREYPVHSVLRFANVYGQMMGEPGHGVTEIFQNGGKTIYGNGNQVRDFIHVAVVWDAIGRARAYPEHWQGATNLATGIVTTINEWFERHGSGEPKYVSPREDDSYASMLDNSKMVRRFKHNGR